MNRKLIAIIALSFLLVAFLSSAAFWIWLQSKDFSKPIRTSTGPALAAGSGSVGRVEPCFNFFDKIDREKLAANLALCMGKFEKLPRPEGMEDDVYAMCELVLNDDTSMKPLCQLTKEKTGQVVDAGFIKEGEYFVTLGDKLIVWRSATGEKVREHAVPLNGANRLLLQTDPTKAVLASDTALMKCSLVDGKVEGSKEYGMGIKSAVMAYLTGSIALCTGDMQCEYVSSDLKESKTLEGKKLDTPTLAIAPKDRAILAVCNKELCRWLVKENRGQVLPPREVASGNYMMFSGLLEDYLILDSHVYGYRAAELIGPVHGTQTPFDFSPAIHQAMPTMSGRTETMLMVVGPRPGEKPGLRVIDYMRSAASQPTRISDTNDVKVFTTWRADRLAVQDAAGINVYQRRAWVGAEGRMWPMHMTDLFWDKRYKQLELAAEYVRKHKRLPCHVSGERVYTDLVNQIATLWNNMEKEAPGSEAQERFKTAEQWRESKSTLALCASANRHRLAGIRSRGFDVASTVTLEQWQKFAEEYQRSIQDLSAIAGDADLPAYSYDLTLLMLEGQGGTYQAGDTILQDFLGKYPYEAHSHEIASQWSLERWGGQRGQGNAYLEKVAGLYPPEWSDIIYARLACRFMMNQPEIEPGEFCVNHARVVKGLAAMAKLEYVSREDLEHGLAYMSFIGAGDPSSLIERHRAQHDTLSEMGYGYNIQHMFSTSMQ